MRALWSRASLNVKLSLLGVFSVIVTAAVLLALAGLQSGRYHDLSRREVNAVISAGLGNITRGVCDIIRIQDEAVQQQLANSLHVAQHVLQNSDTTPDGALVRQVADLVGGAVTVFQRVNRAGDMKSVASTLEQSAYISAAGPAGNPHPAISAVLGGTTYHDRALVADTWYLTTYGPIWSSGGEVRGMVSVSVRMTDVASKIRDVVIRKSVGKTGYVYVLEGSGRQRGTYVISQRGERDGEDIWESRDSDGRLIVQHIVSSALSLGPGRITELRYRWQNPGESRPRWKIAQIAYYRPWDWVIGTGAYEDELQTYWDVLRSGRSQMMAVMFLAGLAITILVGLLGALLSWVIVRPIRRITKVMQTIAGGDLNQMVNAPHHDEIGALATVFNEMSERLRNTMDGLRESERKYRHIYEDAIEGLFQSTPEGRFSRVNPAMARILGYDSPQDLIDSVTDIRTQVYVHPEERDQLVTELESEGRVLGREVQFRRKDGQIIWVSISDRIRFAGGQPLAIEGFLMDVSEKKQEEQKRIKLEEQLRQAQKMETVGLLAGGISHDFNNLLTVIDGYTEIALERSASDQELQSDLQEVKRATSRAATLTSQLLAFSRKQVLQPRILDLGALLAGMVDMVERLLGEDISVRVLGPDALWHVRADPGKIEQVVMNLSVNARDAMPKGGSLSIETSNVTIDEDFPYERDIMRKGDYVLLAVTDTGHGMDPETQKRIFEPFFTTKERGKGTGLGLSMVYGIIKQSGGYVFCSSEPGIGTTFKIFLPRDIGMATEKEHPDEEATQHAHGTERVLLVEDEAAVRRLTASILQSRGYSVLEAGSGEEALQVLSTMDQPLDIVITDVVMPGIDGRELARRIVRQLPSVGVLFVSGYTEDAIGKNGVLEEGLEFIQKPYNPATLLGKARKILDRKKSMNR